MSMERFRQFYDAIRLERRGVHPRLVGDLFDYVDITVGTAIVYASVCMMCVHVVCGLLTTVAFARAERRAPSPPHGHVTHRT